MNEVSIGFCAEELAIFKREGSGLKLQLQGGTPLKAIEIEKSSVNTERTGMKRIAKFFQSNITSSITINIKTEKQLEEEVRTHLTFMPRTCLVQKRMLLFVSGFRNYAAKILLR